MNGFLESYEAALIFLVVAVLAHEPFRWLGLYLGRRIAADSELFVWVRAVATALVATLVMRLLLFPAGELAGVDFWIRAVAAFSGAAIYFAARRNMPAGVCGGAIVLVVAELITK